MGCNSSQPTKRGAVLPNANFVDMSHFQVIRQIGRGGFAEVFLARRNNGPKELVAIKRVDKLRILRVKDDGKGSKNIRMSATAWTERNIWGMIDSAFLVQLIHAFQDDRYLYFVMPLFSGGDMALYLKHHGAMREDYVRFYAAQMVLALEALHSSNIVYRDQKPHNILFRPDGHCCLTDFGLCKINPGTGNGISDLRGRVGTKGFQAPEIINAKGHSYPVDFFALGVTLYRLATDCKLVSKSKEVFTGPIPVPKSVNVIVPPLPQFMTKAKFAGDEGQFWHKYQTGLEDIPTEKREAWRNKFIDKQQAVALPGKEVEITLSDDFIDFVQQLIDIDPCYRLGTKGRNLRPASYIQPAGNSSPNIRSLLSRPAQVSNSDDADEQAENGQSNNAASESERNTERSARGTRTVPTAGNGSTSNRNKVRSTTNVARQPAGGNTNDDGEDYEDDKKKGSPTMSSSRASKAPGRSTNRGGSSNTGGVATKKRTYTSMKVFKGKDDSGEWASLHDGFKEIKQHRFFRGFDWDGLVAFKTPAPFMPVVNMSSIQQNFQDKSPAPNSMPAERRISQEEQDLFRGFELNHVINKEGSESGSETSLRLVVPTKKHARRHKA